MYKRQVALAAAAQAMRDADAALASGDWTAYGTAQSDLDAALKDAIAAEAEISGQVPVDVETVPPGDGTTGTTDAPTDAPTDGAANP